jgi:hypothetical protein
MSKSPNNVSKRINAILNLIIRPLQLLIKPEPAKHSPASNKMTSDIPILGVNSPEKLAHGQCPHCNARVYLWMTGDGVELSTSSQMGNIKVPPSRHAAIEEPARSTS